MQLLDPESDLLDQAAHTGLPYSAVNVSVSSCDFDDDTNHCGCSDWYRDVTDLRVLSNRQSTVQLRLGREIRKMTAYSSGGRTAIATAPLNVLPFSTRYQSVGRSSGVRYFLMRGDSKVWLQIALHDSDTSVGHAQRTRSNSKLVFDGLGKYSHTKMYSTENDSDVP